MSRISFGMMEAGYVPGDLGAFKKEGGKIKLYDSSSGGQPTSQSVTNLTIPEYARPYVEKYLGKAEAVADLGYQPYGGQRIAGFDPFQLQAQQNVANMQTARQLGTATQMAGLAGLRAGEMKYDPATLEQFQMQRPGDVSTGKFTDPNMMQQYMSPYQQAVTDINKREAARQSDMMAGQQAAKFAQAGAFGGGRQAMVEAERRRNLGQQMGDIQAQGSQAAFQQGAQQFQMDQQRALQAALANQQMGYGTEQANLQAKLGVQQLGEQSRQFGANLGMQGIQQQLASAGLLGNLGQMEFGQQKDIINALNAAGAQRQGLEQGRLDMDYQDFMRQQQYPYQQLGFMFDALRGLPLSQYAQMNYQKDPSLVSQGIGGYLTYKGLFDKAEGGIIEEPAGLADLAIMKMGS